MKLREQTHQKITTRGADGTPNGYLVPIYSVTEHFFAPGREPQQVYLTALAPAALKGPHLHHVRTGFFTCIKGDVRVVVRIHGEYQQYYSGENHQYRSLEIPTDVPAVIQNVGEGEALVLNMPNPAWTPEMHDEHSADFSDFDFHK